LLDPVRPRDIGAYIGRDQPRLPGNPRSVAPEAVA
jgi:hypothetical protein